MSIEQNLIAVRDTAHLNQGALGAVGTQAQEQYDLIRSDWEDSATKRAMLKQLATIVTSYRNAQREALELRDLAIGALGNITETPPPLPDAGTGTWSVESW